MKSDSGEADCESGYIVVETIGAFIPFMLLIISILSLVNIVAVQARVHYAITQAAGTLSMYCYTLEVMGISNDLTVLADKADKVNKGIRDTEADIAGVIEGLDTISLDLIADHAGSIAGRAETTVGSAVADPKNALQMVLNWGVGKGESELFEMLLRPLVGRYLSIGTMTGDEYLRSVGVVSGAGGYNAGSSSFNVQGLSALGFSGLFGRRQNDSILLDRNGNVRIAVDYEIEYTFFGLRLPFRPTIKISQEVVTKAWLNGSGRGYW